LAHVGLNVFVVVSARAPTIAGVYVTVNDVAPLVGVVVMLPTLDELPTVNVPGAIWFESVNVTECTPSNVLTPFVVTVQVVDADP